MEVMTRDFGEIEVRDEDVITFPAGLPGFEEEKRFVLIPLEEGGSPFYVLQSVDSPGAAFVVLEPWQFLPEYSFDLSGAAQDMLQVADPSDLVVFLMATIRDAMEEMTVNLAAPLVVNHKEQLGRQVILEGEEYEVRHRLFSEPEKMGVC